MMKPQIVNIVNFIRGNEPRDPGLDLLEPVVHQLRLLREHRLAGTFLLQYDALMKPEFTQLLKDQPGDIEIGGWFEVVRPLVEKAGLSWRGRPDSDWDWRPFAGFSIGYPPEEREKLVDVYMEDFKGIFGRYPESVGAWIIDAHTLTYMADRYGIAASCNCRDQWGTDGYTLWGGYYGQAYYPSRKNVFSPAQHPGEQISVPVFRMLGSDPIYQYDAGLDWSDEAGRDAPQPVVTLEPVCVEGGGSPEWVRWFFGENYNGKCLSFGYAQAGQENSFGWRAMAEGFADQAELIAKWVEEGELKALTLRDTGKWFRGRYAFTPCSAVVAATDWKHCGRRSIWYCSRFYRVNLYMEEGRLWIRDLHLFDEKYEERYLKSVCNDSSFIYDNLPCMDGNRWSGGHVRAGIYFVDAGGGEAAPALKGGEISVEQAGEDDLAVFWALDGGGRLKILCQQRRIVVSGGNGERIKWAMQMRYCAGEHVPITEVSGDAVRYDHNGHAYTMNMKVGGIERKGSAGLHLLYPVDGKLVFTCG
jgi:hypothetical protein